MKPLHRIYTHVRTETGQDFQCWLSPLLPFLGCDLDWHHPGESIAYIEVRNGDDPIDIRDLIYAGAVPAEKVLA